MSRPSVIVIGAGLGGLSTGTYALMNGYACRIFEHARHPGGVAAEWKRQGYTIDGGIHFYMGYRPGRPDHALYRELGIDQQDPYRKITTYGRFLDPDGGPSLDITGDLERLAQTLKARSPGDAAWVDRVIGGARTFKGGNLSASMAKPPEMNRWWDTLLMMFRMRKTLRYYSGWYLRPMEEAVKDLQDPWVAHVFKHLFLPGVPVVFVMMLLGVLADGHMAIRTDGSGGFARALEKRFLDLGGEVTYRSTVEKILVEKDRAVGVRLANGEEHRADHVVSAADGYSTLYDLLGDRYVPPDLKALHEDGPLWKPVVLLNYGVARDFSDEPSITVLKPTGKPDAGFLSGEVWVVRTFNYCPHCAPPGRTLVQVMIESEWAPWKELRKDREAYDDEKRRAAEQVLDGLNEVWPGIREQVEMTNVATPHTWWRFTRNRRGAFEGFAVTDKIFTAKVRRTLPGLDGFVMAGQWVVPGGGVVPTLMTGKHAAMLLCRRDGKRFRTLEAR